MNHWANLLFSCVFLGQIFLISHVVPRKILARMRRIRETYPPESHPKLYPRPLASVLLAETLFRWANRAIFALGFVLLGTILWLDAADGFVSEAWPAAYGMIQFLPLALLELSEWGQVRRMREARSATTRRATLRRRTFFQLVPPLVLVAAVVSFAASLLLELTWNRADPDWGQIGTLSGGQIFLAVMGAIAFFRRPENPHQSPADRERVLAANLNSLSRVSIVMSVFFATLSVDLGFLDAPMLSLYFQAIVLLSVGHVLRVLRLEDLDFEVYRADQQPVGS